MNLSFRQFQVLVRVIEGLREITREVALCETAKLIINPFSNQAYVFSYMPVIVFITADGSESGKQKEARKDPLCPFG